MKIGKYVIILSFLIVGACSGEDNNEFESSNQADWKCGTHNGNQLWTGPRGGCYYINSNDNKTYVDRSECNCSN